MGLPRLQQHVPDLSVFKKATFGGEMPRRMPAIDRIITELRELDAIP